MDESIESMIVDEGEIILPVSVEYRDDITKDDFYELCRLCGNCSKQLIPIFTGDGAEHSLPEKIKEHLPLIRVTQDDSLPLNVCYQCASTLIAWHELYYACQEADQRLREICRKMQLKTEITSGEIYDEIPIDFMISDKVKKCEDSLDEQDDVENTEADPELSDASTSINSTTDVVYEKNLEMATENHKIAESSTPNDGYDLHNTMNLASKANKMKNEEEESLPSEPSSNESITLVSEQCSVCCAEIRANGRYWSGTLLCSDCHDEQMDNVEKGRTDEAMMSVTTIPEYLQRFVISRPGEPTHMRCDKCEYVCQPLVHVFEKHYLTHTAFGNTTTEATCDDQESFHTSSNSSEDKLQCAICNKTFLRKGSLISHLRRHEKLTCKKCSCTFKSLVLLKSHKKRHIRQKSTNNTLIFCEFCKKYFKTKKGFAYHQQKICVQYKCYVCNETFVTHSVLQEHLRRVHDVEKKPVNNVQQVNNDETLMSVCPVCSKIVTHAVLPRHMLLHSKEEPFICDLCGKRFKRKNSLQDHIMIEMGMKNYVCDICGMKFLKQGYLNKHQRYHKLNNGEFQGFQCEVCGKRFPEKWRLGVHQRAVHKGGEFSSCNCDICGKKFAERWMVRKHKHIEHNGEEFREYVCDICGKRFKEKWMIKSHQRNTHRGGVKRQYCDLCGHSDHTSKDCRHRQALQDVQCVLCGESFSSTYFLKEHVNSAHDFEAKNESCSTVTQSESLLERSSEMDQKVLILCAGCGQYFNNKVDLRDHEAKFKCNRETKYECLECGKVFTSKFSLSNHLMIHKKASAVVPFKCTLCGKEFFTGEALERHQALQKICLLCDKVYPCNEHLKTHVFSIHRNDVDDASSTNDESKMGHESDGKPYECKLCHKKFSRKQAMENHLFAEMNLRRHVCEFCDKSYNYYSHLKEHLVTCHGEKEFICGYCGRDFPTKKRFRDHVTLHSAERPFRCTCGIAFKLNRYLSKHKKHCKATPAE